MGGFVSSFVLFPMEVVKTKVATESDKTVTVLDITKREYHRAGLTGLFSGAHAAGLQSAMEKFLYFYNFKLLATSFVATRNRIQGGNSTQIGFLADVAIGCVHPDTHAHVACPCSCRSLPPPSPRTPRA